MWGSWVDSAGTVEALAINHTDELQPEEVARNAVYTFLALVLYSPPGDRARNIALELAGDGTALGQTFAAFANAFEKADPGDTAAEYHNLFIGVGRGELVPFESYYLTGFLNEKPLAVLRDNLAELGFERAAGVSEPEDHIAALCDVMGAMVAGTSNGEFTIYEQERFFSAHLDRWAAQFFSDLATTKTDGLYRHVARIGEEFMRIEKDAFEMIERA